MAKSLSALFWLYCGCKVVLHTRTFCSPSALVMSCSPNTTQPWLTTGFPFTQCAAVRTSWELIRLPPQKGLEDLEERRPTIQGYSLAFALTPSTILDTALASPHLHEE